jgi:hypothetical protein
MPRKRNAMAMRRYARKNAAKWAAKAERTRRLQREVRR